MTDIAIPRSLLLDIGKALRDELDQAEYERVGLAVEGLLDATPTQPRAETVVAEVEARMGGKFSPSDGERLAAALRPIRNAR